jgi:hypothetical protein
MTSPTPSPIATSPEDGPAPARENPCVARCCNAWERAYQATAAGGKSDYFCRIDAAVAYRNSMPSLSGFDSARDFVACVAHGLLIGAIPAEQATKLLYAAQVALSTHRTASKTHQPKGSPARRSHTRKTEASKPAQK